MILKSIPGLPGYSASDDGRIFSHWHRDGFGPMRVDDEQPRAEKWIDPMPPHGMAERLYAGMRARFGFWSSDFMHVVKVAYRDRIPPRFEELARRLERDRPWELELEELSLGGCTITVERADGSRSSTYYPKGEEP